MKQYKYDKLLGIKTAENRNQSYPFNENYNPYEPTAYETLEILLADYPMDSTDHIVDFGCGKGRVNFYLHHYTGATVKGVDLEDDYIEAALVNLEGYKRKHQLHRPDGIEFFLCLAEEYRIVPEDNRFYFFNPFSVHVFRKVVDNILRSLEAHPRSVDLVLYYPHAEYIRFLERNTGFELVDELVIDGFYKKDEDERILIYRI